ncbi:MAG: 1-acyl-sn-glycerol-3-phosphate acyltransferase, partial [Alphaproteobacteria bacterium]|nr:1-acyl-sn-glycerol-3-phosphate acyltransferase [Alphaproteobacteria bacterium]
VLLPLPRRTFQDAVGFWQRMVFWGLRAICGITWEARGRDRIPAGGVLFACKHQSAWDTMVFYALAADPAYVLKKELMGIPFWGWYVRKTRHVVVDRKAGMKALKDLAQRAQAFLGEGRQVVIFPQGTRVPPGVAKPYLPGVFSIYTETGAPVIPVALNSGLFWGRRSFRKHPGVITIEFLDPMPRGLERKPFSAELKRRVEEASDRLAAEARGRFPWL